MLDLRPEGLPDNEPYIRLSHSTLEAIQTCYRKFEMDKLLTFGAKRVESEHLPFGHGFGAFVATYIQTGDFNMSALMAWYEYMPIVESDKKNQATLYHLIERCVSELDALREEWEVAEFNGIPAVELSFRIDIDEYFYYVGYVDVVLKNKTDGRLAVLEVKSTGLQLQDIAPLYKFSGQALGYSIVLDEVAENHNASYDVMYFVGRLGKTAFSDGVRSELHVFRKTMADRLDWFMALAQQVETLHTCLKYSNFPRISAGCLKYNKPCPHFGVCHMRSGDKYKKIEIDEIEYQFRYRLDDLIESHIQRIG